MLRNTLLVGSLVGLLSVGTIALNFNGESTINDTKDFMSKATQQLQLFKDNESKLASTINSLKSSKKDLLEQIAILEKSNNDKSTEIANLNNQISTLNSKIQELEELLANGGSTNDELINENNRLNEELNKANNEITKANNLIASLQSDLSVANTILENNKPMTNDELNILMDDNTVVPPTNEEEEEVPPTPPTTQYDYTITSSEDYYSFEDLTVMIMGTQWVFEGTAQYPVVVHFTDGTTKDVNPNSVEDLTKTISKITYTTSSGTTKAIQVNR